jgi:hypothetical protein
MKEAIHTLHGLIKKSQSKPEALSMIGELLKDTGSE